LLGSHLAPPWLIYPTTTPHQGVNYWGELLPPDDSAGEGGQQGESGVTGAEALFLTASYQGRLVLAARVPMQGWLVHWSAFSFVCGKGRAPGADGTAAADKRQELTRPSSPPQHLSLIHISEPYATAVVFPFLAQFFPANVLPDAAKGRSAQATWEAVKDKVLTELGVAWDTNVMMGGGVVSASRRSVLELLTLRMASPDLV